MGQVYDLARRDYVYVLGQLAAVHMALATAARLAQCGFGVFVRLVFSNQPERRLATTYASFACLCHTWGRYICGLPFERALKWHKIVASLGFFLFLYVHDLTMLLKYWPTLPTLLLTVCDFVSSLLV